jgi:sec-independent protein translocase protein TatA
MPGIGPWELVIILLIVVVIFGAGRLAEIGGAVGKSVREFRSATHDDDKSGAAAHTVATQTTTPVAAQTTTPVATASATPVENKCPSCATVNPASQVFCGQCGTRLTRAA